MFIDGFLHDDFVDFVRSVPWRFAKTMPHMPHEYTLRKQSRERGLESHFESAARFIREEGYRQQFGSKVYTYYDVPDEEGAMWQYWTMGAPYERTILINRARVQPAKRVQEGFHLPAHLFRATTCRPPDRDAEALRVACRGLLDRYYAGSCMWSSENYPSTHSGE